MPAPLCFVLMPFGQKTGPGGAVIDFDDVYERLIAPAIRQADLEPLRAGKDCGEAVTRKPMFERFILCPYAVVDLTVADANAYYELGVRQAVRPRSTVLVCAEGERAPFDVQDLLTIPYKLEGSRLAAAPIETARVKITKALQEARSGAKDRLLVQILDYIPEPIVDHTRTDVFRRQVRYSESLKERLSEARRSGVDAVRAAHKSLGILADVEAGALIDLMLSYRAVEAHSDTLGLIDEMPPPLAETVLVREQRAFALNRLGRRDQAESVLLKLIEEHGHGSERCALLGRIYKDQWEEARSPALLDKAIDAYLNGFETDWRDAFPGVNAVTLMELREPPDSRRAALLPVVRYAVERKIEKGPGDYWDYATLLELALIEMNEPRARDALQKALALVRETWEPKTTQRNLRLLRETREARGVVKPWMLEVESAL